MKVVIIKIVLVLLFVFSVFMVNYFGNAFEYNGYTYPGYPGGAIGFGLIAAICVWSYIYLECNYSKPKKDDVLKNRWFE